MSATTSTTPSGEPSETAAAPVLLDEMELGAWRGLLRVHQLPLSSYEVLLFLADAPGGQLRMSELADGVLLSRSGLTRLVDRMEREGLLCRERCTNDGRGYLATITDEGRELFRRARKTHLDGVRERFLSHFSADELRTLAQLWERVVPGAAS